MQSKSVDWFLYERGLRHERIKEVNLDEYSCSKKRKEVVTPQNILLLLLRNCSHTAVPIRIGTFVIL